MACVVHSYLCERPWNYSPGFFLWRFFLKWNFHSFSKGILSLPELLVSSLSWYEVVGFCYLCLVFFSWLQCINRGQPATTCWEISLTLLWAASISYIPIPEMIPLESLLTVNFHLSPPGLRESTREVFAYFSHCNVMENSE